MGGDRHHPVDPSCGRPDDHATSWTCCGEVRKAFADSPCGAGYTRRKQYVNNVTSGVSGGGSNARRRGRHRRRCRPGRVCRRVPLCLRGPGRAAPGEVGVPPGQGLRGRSDPACRRRAGPHGAAAARAGRLDPQRRPAGARGRSPPRARVARAVQLPVVRAGEVADVPGPHARRPRAFRRRQAAGAHHRDRTGARRALGPGGGRAGQGRRRHRHVPRPGRHRGRRGLRAARDGHGAGEAHGPPHGGRGPHLLPHAAPRRPVDGEPPRAARRRRTT